ncbi:MAG: hypothetical protein J6C23_04005 [Clostridia bacterium]|nr:hypothetical protein [Clostridia bacterium]
MLFTVRLILTVVADFMYGYFDPDKVFLKNNERNVFNAYYCRLCYCLWNKGGQPARYLTTYDAAVYNLVVAVAGSDQRPPLFACERIKTKNKNYYKEDKLGNLIAELSLIGFYIKVKDNETDGDKAKAFWAKLLFGRLMKKTVENNKEVYAKSDADIVKMDTIQQAGAPIEEVLSAYADAVVNGFRRYFDFDEKYFDCIRRISRWVLLIDMFDDYNEDVKRNLPNSLKREGCNTLSELFDKYYWELIPLVRKEIEGMKEALYNICDGSTEWIVLNKILRHSMATLIPDIINGKDISYHYFRHTCIKNLRSIEYKRIREKNEKNSAYNKGN